MSEYEYSGTAVAKIKPQYAFKTESGSIPLRNWIFLLIPSPIPELELNWNWLYSVQAELELELPSFELELESELLSSELNSELPSWN